MKYCVAFSNSTFKVPGDLEVNEGEWAWLKTNSYLVNVFMKKHGNSSKKSDIHLQYVSLLIV